MKRLIDTHNREHGVPYTLGSEGVLNHVVLVDPFVPERRVHVPHPKIAVAHVDLTEAFVEEDFGSPEHELESELIVITGQVASSAWWMGRRALYQAHMN